MAFLLKVLFYYYLMAAPTITREKERKHSAISYHASQKNKIEYLTTITNVLL